MKLFSIGKDGGPESNVTGFFLVEIKSLFSIVFLKFAKGTRESFHSHAFNALTLWLKGQVCEEYPDGKGRPWFPGDFKFTPKKLMHRVRAFVDSYAISVRGPWDLTWQEYNESTKETTTLTKGREVVDVLKDVEKPVRWLSWIEAWGPSNEPIFCFATEEACVSLMKNARGNKGSYPDDKTALLDFIAVHWATFAKAPNTTVPKEDASYFSEEDLTRAIARQGDPGDEHGN